MQTFVRRMAVLVLVASNFHLTEKSDLSCPVLSCPVLSPTKPVHETLGSGSMCQSAMPAALAYISHPTQKNPLLKKMCQIELYYSL